MPVHFSRRSAMGLIGGAAAAFTFDLPTLCARAQAIAEGQSPYFYLTKDEAAVLTALVDRIIPADDFPSASQAGVVDYIDFQLATAWGKGSGLYMEGPFFPGTPEQGYQLPYAPAEFYRKALAEIMGDDPKRFPGQSDEEKDAFVERLSNGEVKLGDIPGRTFFESLRANVMEGYFADPVYNGNRDYIGWRMIGFPGADAYYTTEFDRYNMVYWREPSGVADRPDIGTQRFTARDVPAASQSTAAVQTPGG